MPDLSVCSFPGCSADADAWPFNQVGRVVPVCDEHSVYFPASSDSII
jgi:hypothetical protein